MTFSALKKALAGACLASSLFAIPAFAADLPGRAAPPVYVAPIGSWTGFYLGVNGGYGFGQTNHFDFLSFGNAAPHNVNGGFGGGTVGYDYQFGQLVAGVLADADYAAIKGSTSCPVAAFSCSTRLSFLGSLRGRLGYTSGAALFYLTGGLGVDKYKYNDFVTATGTQSAFKAGGAIGAGIEYAFSPNWAVKAEYLYYAFGNTYAAPGVLSAGTVALHTSLNTVRVGLDYKFSTPAPVVARY